MAHAFLKPRDVNMIRPALLPLEPLSSLDGSGASAHFAASLEPRDLPEALQPATHQLTRRALRTNVIPLSYNLSGAKPGVVVGATLGAIAGFLILTWLIFVLMGGAVLGARRQTEVEDVHVTRRSNRSHRSRRTRTHRSEMSERSTPPPQPRRRERILVEETVRRTDRSRPPPEPAPMSPEREIHEVEVEEDRRVSGDDVIEVMEEESVVTPEPPRRKKSGYRTVDPNAYGGGNYEQREVSRDRRRSSRRH